MTTEVESIEVIEAALATQCSSCEGTGRPTIVPLPRSAKDKQPRSNYWCRYCGGSGLERYALNPPAWWPIVPVSHQPPYLGPGSNGRMRKD